MSNNTTHHGIIAFACLSSVIILIFTILLQRKYNYKHTPILVNIVVIISWYLTFISVTFLLTVDMFAFTHDIMFHVWNAIYWTSFLMTWIVIPLVYSYYEAGEFTPKARFVASLRANLLFYCIAGVLIVIFMIYIGIKNRLGLKAMLGFLVCISQVWGLILLTLLMGYGLVEIPRQLWRNSDYNIALKAIHYKAAMDFQELEEAKDEVADALKILNDVSKKVKPASRLRKYVDIIEASIPSIATLGFDPHDRRTARYLESALSNEIREKYDSIMDQQLLAKLNYYCKNSLRSLLLAQNQWDETLEASESLEYLITEQRNDVTPPAWNTSFFAAFHWRYTMHLRDYVYQFFAIITATLSILLVWGQLTSMSSKNISPIPLLMNSIYKNESLLLLFALIIAMYCTLCACVGMWQLRLFTYYYMRKSHTDGSSLLLNASYLQRLIGPLGYNFYLLLRWKGTAFQEVLGRMDVVPFFGSYFNIYFPITIALFALATVSNVYGRFLKLLGISYFEPHGNYSGDMITEGRMLIRKSQRMKTHHTRRRRDNQQQQQDQIQLLSSPISLDSALGVDDL